MDIIQLILFTMLGTTIYYMVKELINDLIYVRCRITDRIIELIILAIIPYGVYHIFKKIEETEQIRQEIKQIRQENKQEEAKTTETNRTKSGPELELEQKEQELEQFKQMVLKRMKKEKQLVIDLYYKEIDTTENIKRLIEIISIGTNEQTVELAKIIENLIESESISEAKKLEITMKLYQIRHWNIIPPTKPEITQPQEITK